MCISALEDPNYENIEVGTLRRLASAFDVALTVRFVPFSELATWTVELSQDKLLIPDFSSDTFKPRTSSSLALNFQSANLAILDMGSTQFSFSGYVGDVVMNTTSTDNAKAAELLLPSNSLGNMRRPAHTNSTNFDRIIVRG